VHPGQPPIGTAAGLAGPLVDYPFDTTRTAVQLVLNGIMDRYPGARIILSHADGFVPYASHRFAELALIFRLDAADPTDILKSFQRVYFDTALSSGPAALPSLTAFAQQDHILFGTDYPFAPADVAASFTGKLDAIYQADSPRAQRDQPSQCGGTVSAPYGTEGRSSGTSQHAIEAIGREMKRQRAVIAS
jgi:predicted TIM-barrel fold metal-dependent hydrolase